MNTLIQKNALPTEVPQRTSWARTLGQCARAAVALCLLTGVAYPLATTVVAQWAFAHRADGSLIVRDGQLVGSELIGQSFTSAKYFQGRPSVTTAPDPVNAEATVASPYNAALSAGSNQGVTSKALESDVSQRVQDYRSLNGLGAQDRVPVDAVTASASGLDPHVSVANARLQAARVAAARGLGEQQVLDVLTQHIESRALGLWGEPRVNVLALNLALDQLAAQGQGKE